MGLWSKLFTSESDFTSSVKCSPFVISQMTPAITFDDVLLEPRFSDIESRKDVSVSTTLIPKHIELNIPIISANMDTVSGLEMAKAMGHLGGMAILHRYQDMSDILKQIHHLKSIKVYSVPSIGVQEGEFNKAMEYMKAGADAICIDIAHGDSAKIIKLVKRLYKSKVKIIAGNVATHDGVLRLADAGAHVVKLGIGPGSLCTTRVVTGHGVPQVTAIMEAVKVKKKFKKLKIIADGGIRNSGDIVKALAFGADAVMIGSLLAGTIESPGSIVNGHKVYRGMASKDARSDFDPNLPIDYTPEGVAAMKPVSGPVNQIINQLVGGLRSGLSYSGAYSLKELRDNARFMLISSASYIENTPHGLNI